MFRPTRALVFRKIILSICVCASVAMAFYLLIFDVLWRTHSWVPRRDSSRRAPALESAAVDLDVRARETLHVLDDVRLRDVVEGAVRKPQVADRRVPEPSHFESSLALLAGHVADVDIVDIGALGP